MIVSRRKPFRPARRGKSLAALAVMVLLAVESTSAAKLEKWLYCSTNLLVDENVDALDRLWRRAAAAGYSHVLLADSKFSRLDEMDPRYFANIDRVKKLAAECRLEIVPALFSIGYSNDLLHHDPNLIEALPIKNLPMVVRAGAAVVDDPDAPVLPDFSNLKAWSWHDEIVETEDGAARVVDPKGRNARICQRIAVKPFRQYHVSVQVRTRDFRGQPAIKALAPADRQLNWENLGAKSTQNWTEMHAVFNSQNHTEVALYFGVWDGGTGSLWWKNPRIEEVAFVNLVRRGGAPLVVRGADGRGLTEGRDFARLDDPLLGAKPWRGEYDTWHTPPVLKTSLPDGTRLSADYYAAQTIHDHQAMICPSEPRTMELLRDQAKRMHRAWGARGYMMSHDEVRVMNWCAACASRGATPGRMLADNVRACIGILRKVNPGGRIYVWSDMFDPHHNAVKSGYYLVNGSLAGAWEGLDKDVIVVPWYFEKRRETLAWFAGRGHRQLIAGYYDAAPARIVDWLKAAADHDVVGVMYTTWENNYADLEAFSAAVDAATPSPR